MRYGKKKIPQYLQGVLWSADINNLDLEELIAAAEKKFGGEFNQILFLEQLTYFDDLEITEIEFIDKSYSEKEIKDYLENTVENYLATNPII